MRDYNDKERDDIKGCYNCFYWFMLLMISGWLIATFAIQINMLVMVTDFNAQLDATMENNAVFHSMRGPACPLASQLETLIERYPQRFEHVDYFILQVVC